VATVSERPQRRPHPIRLRCRQHTVRAAGDAHLNRSAAPSTSSKTCHERSPQGEVRRARPAALPTGSPVPEHPRTDPSDRMSAGDRRRAPDSPAAARPATDHVHMQVNTVWRARRRIDHVRSDQSSWRAPLRDSSSAEQRPRAPPVADHIALAGYIQKPGLGFTPEARHDRRQ